VEAVDHCAYNRIPAVVPAIVAVANDAVYAGSVKVVQPRQGLASTRFRPARGRTNPSGTVAAPARLEALSSVRSLRWSEGTQRRTDGPREDLASVSGHASRLNREFVGVLLRERLDLVDTAKRSPSEGRVPSGRYVSWIQVFKGGSNVRRRSSLGHLIVGAARSRVAVADS